MALASHPETLRRTRVFRTGNSLAVRLPAGWSEEGCPVTLALQGTSIVLKPETWKTAAELLRALRKLGPGSLKRPRLGAFRPRSYSDHELETPLPPR